MFIPRDVTCHETVAIELDKHTILGELFLNEYDLFGATHDEITTRIERTLVQLSHLGLGFTVQVALLTAQHDRQPTNHQVVAYDSLIASRVLNVHDDFSRVGLIT